ncbi:hypothetical protein N6H14_28295 [Paenibacillus sp. CC-CFT747]|nr:hypothetical protein N6H14_28295 [Paenibacillus sp. CC-CFT747]
MGLAKWETVQVNTFDVRGQLPLYVEEAARAAAEAGARKREAIADPEALNARQQYIRESLERSLGDSLLRSSPATGGDRGNQGQRLSRREPYL